MGWAQQFISISGNNYSLSVNDDTPELLLRKRDDEPIEDVKIKELVSYIRKNKSIQKEIIKIAKKKSEMENIDVVKKFHLEIEGEGKTVNILIKSNKVYK